MTTTNIINRLLALAMCSCFSGIQLVWAQAPNKARTETVSQVAGPTAALQMPQGCPSPDPQRIAKKHDNAKPKRREQAAPQPESAPQNVVEYRGP